MSNINLCKLKEPFPANDIEWRMQKTGVKNGKPWGMCLAYVTSRAIMDRLDEVCGPEAWENTFEKGPDGGIICGITIHINKPNWSGGITKWDGAENTKVEEVKGGLSSAMKRAGVQWGIGRYLYKLDATFANFSSSGTHSVKIDGKFYKWDPPQLPAWALPSVENCTGSHCKVVEPESVKKIRKILKKEKLGPLKVNDENEARMSKAITAFANIKVFVQQSDLESLAVCKLADFNEEHWKLLSKHLKELGSVDEGKRLDLACFKFNLPAGSMG